MAVGITPDTSNENPYITVAEYKNAPTSLSLSTLVVNGNQQAQDAELESVILRASSYMNEYFNQNLVADEYTETQRIRYSASGGYFDGHGFGIFVDEADGGLQVVGFIAADRRAVGGIV